MNLFFRLLRVWLTWRARPALDFLAACRTPFRVWPSDLDLLRHMNNGVYFSLQDLARTDLMYRASLAGPIAQHGWYPVVEAETLQFRKSLELWQRFEIETQVMGWDEKAFLLRHRFWRGDVLVAEGAIRARFLSRKGGKVSPQELLAATGKIVAPPQLPAWMEHWSQDQVELRVARP